MIEKNSWNILSKLITFNVEESTQRSLLHAEIDKYAKESLANFIVKGVTDESWTAYENTLKNISAWRITSPCTRPPMTGTWKPISKIPMDRINLIL